MKTTKWTADRIRAMRKRFGLSQADLVERLPFTIDTLQFWEQERGEVSEAGEWILDRVERELELDVPPTTNGKHRRAGAAAV